jgi:hypothetical protein
MLLALFLIISVPLMIILGIASFIYRRKLMRLLELREPHLLREFGLKSCMIEQSPKSSMAMVKLILIKDLHERIQDHEIKNILKNVRRVDIAYYLNFFFLLFGMLYAFYGSV